MSSPKKETEVTSCSADIVSNGAGASGGSGEPDSSSDGPRPPAKRSATAPVIEISDTESDDSDICAVTSYQATADEVKRIRGDEYSSTSSSSSSDYSTDEDSPCEDDSVVIDDYFPNKKVVRAQLNTRANRMDDPLFNPKLKSDEILTNLTEHWNSNKTLDTPDVTLHCDPFRLCVLHNFLENPDIINNIIDDMNTLDWTRKKMDLYEFHQTADLASLTWQRSIRGIYELLKTDVMEWVSKLTGLELNSVSASCSLYGPGDHLLCHDDRLGDRKVAFILYLAPWQPPQSQLNGACDGDTVEIEDTVGWSKKMGGCLQLIEGDDQGPKRQTRSLCPSNNMLAFFRVTDNSYHQVEEVLSLELPRLSINGWFHGPGIESPPPPREITEIEKTPYHNDVVLINAWVDSAYMTPRARLQVQRQMEADSEVSLQSFLQAEQCDALLQALASPEVEWEECGPLDRRRYARVTPSWLEAQTQEHPVHALRQLMTSLPYFRLLADCTDLQLKSYSQLEVRKVRPADYTLIPPQETYQEARLESLYYLGVPSRVCGGGAVFVSPHDAAPDTAPDAALVTVPPTHNALSLVYCDVGAASFIKYLSRMTVRENDCFYLFTCSYWE